VRILSVALAALIALAVTARAEDKSDKEKSDKDKSGKIDKAKLVGTWTFVKTDGEDQPPEGATLTIEFTKDGKFNINYATKEKSFKVPGTYKVEGSKLTTMVKLGDQEKTETVTIKELTDKKLITTEKKGEKVETTEFKK